MPFKFEWLCECLEELHAQQFQRLKSSARSQDPDARIVKLWFRKYNHKIPRDGPPALAFLSALLPDQRVDRVYNLQDGRLSNYFGRALGLGASRAKELNQWRQRDGDDFPICLERVMAECEFDAPAPGNEVTLEELDSALEQIAANSPFSSPALRLRANGCNVDDLLNPIVRRLKSHEAKWLVRIILKSFGSVRIPESTVLKEFHFLMPDLLKIQNSLGAAINILQCTSLQRLPVRPCREYEELLLPLVTKDIKPCLGVMVKRQPYFKARSIKHACYLAKGAAMSVERKYDGEYCQIHIDLSKGRNCIQIFSKSGKDSTEDRIGLHDAIRRGLRLDQSLCGIKERCIIEGELLVWDSSVRTVQPFHKIRKHVLHGGRAIGTASDSPVGEYERLMVVFYDLLILDQLVLMHETHSRRRYLLEDLVNNTEGRALVGERRIIDFSSSCAVKQLNLAFAHAIRHGWEGLVLKECDTAFFSWGQERHGVKLKKDYFAGLGESADLCIIGAWRDPKFEEKLRLGYLRWTNFSVACLTNKEHVQRLGAKPVFKIVDELTRECLPRQEFLDLNRLGRLCEINYEPLNEYMEVQLGYSNIRQPSELFTMPFVVEVMGAGFVRLPNSPFYTLRFPRKIGSKIKIHSDRGVEDSTDFQELQEMAKASLSLPLPSGSHYSGRLSMELLRTDDEASSTQSASRSTDNGYASQTINSNDISGVNSVRQQQLVQACVHAGEEESESHRSGPFRFDKNTNASTLKARMPAKARAHRGNGDPKQTSPGFTIHQVLRQQLQHSGSTNSRPAIEGDTSLLLRSECATEARRVSGSSRVLKEIVNQSIFTPRKESPSQSLSKRFSDIDTGCNATSRKRPPTKSFASACGSPSILRGRKGHIGAERTSWCDHDSQWPPSEVAESPQICLNYSGGFQSVSTSLEAEPYRSFIHRAGSIYITPSVLDMRATSQHLKKDTALPSMSLQPHSFTTSASRFIDDVDFSTPNDLPGKRPVHITLIDSSAPDAAAADIRALCGVLRARTKDRLFQSSAGPISASTSQEAHDELAFGYSNRICILDYVSFLQSLGDRQTRRTLSVDTYVDMDTVRRAATWTTITPAPSPRLSEQTTVRSSCGTGDPPKLVGVLVLDRTRTERHYEHEYHLADWAQWERALTINDERWIKRNGAAVPTYKIT